MDKVTVSFGGFDLIKEVNFLIQPDDRIGLIGKNGAGKTTLLKIISGLLQPTTGDVNVPKETTIGYLPQEMVLKDSNTLIGEKELDFAELLEIDTKINRLYHEISVAPDYHTEEYLKKLGKI